ncbi:MAG: TAT-variant-translocated molybdopterin oxidoreductase [Thermoanaerobaculum sp.]|nr:TAT-variant-translocated molybdopterin oxidoreductase [Thermoanaerobaculum sp.]MDW7966570.1 TAT-variant-translocated molybdopterin oxidoreductase [Thermoanaerobaculum sp.]
MSKAYWRSLEELAQSAEFQQQMAAEFPSLVEALQDPRTRRDFLKLMAASLGMVGLTACRWPKEHILPFAGQPEQHIPGVPRYFATAMSLFGGVLGLVVTSYDGRPIKIEGNALHPESRGATHLWAQAALLELYDPDRSQQVVQRAAGQRVLAGWEGFRQALASLVAMLKRRQGAGVWIIADGTPSLTRRRLRDALRRRFPGLNWVDWDPLANPSERQGLQQATGVAAVAKPLMERAQVTVSIASDLLMQHPTAVANARGFAERRREGKNRLLVAEPVPTVTGASADYRLAVRPDRLVGLVVAVAQELKGRGLAVPLDLPPAATLAGEEQAFVARCAEDLLRVKGNGLIAVGPELPPAAHGLVFCLNQALGVEGPTVQYFPAPPVEGNLGQLVQAAQQGKVELVVFLGGNPVATAPHIPWREVLGSATVVRLGLYEDETSRLAQWHLPQAHFLESWGDLVGVAGEYSVVQPLIAPLYQGITAEELLAWLAGDERPAYQLVRETFAQLTGSPQWEEEWRHTLHDGIWRGRVHQPLALEFRPGPWAEELATIPVAQGLVAWRVTDNKILDGRFANNAWLQELPDPISKLTWGHAALLSPETARQLAVRHGEVVRVQTSVAEVQLPCFVLPGTAPDTVGLVLGYGRSAAGRVGNGVGVDVAVLFGPQAMVPVSLAGTRRRGDLACTQDQQAIDRVGLEALGHRVGELIREVPASALPTLNPLMEPGQVRPPMPWRERPMAAEYQWGMAVDLAACIGCGACVVACQAENNIPVVGKKQVQRGRQMHWIRVDRYFSGKPENPKLAFQPMLCQHCENAPCEQVCPVAATVHNEEGLNQMVYNRCVGTRYCSNNCPYKVRRFNFFNYFKDLPPTTKMLLNPEVTVRSRGVMEKCTFCVQRIERAKITARNERRPLRDGEVVPACAQVCPTQAIVFGNLNDATSRVAQLHRDPRAYGVLTELNTRPRVLYLAKIENVQEEG